MMLGQEQVRQLRVATNTALGLPDMHRLGQSFVDHFIVIQMDAEPTERYLTTYDGLRGWCDGNAFNYQRESDGTFSKLRMSPSRYRVLIGLLEFAQILLRVELLYEGGDAPLPPGVK